MVKQYNPKYRMKILVVDDDEEIRKTAGRMIRQMGYEAILAGEGTEAVKLFKNNKDAGTPFDTVIMDLSMPNGMGGREAIKELLSIDPRVKTVVSSGDSCDPAIVNPGEYGFCHALPKPYTIDELSNILNKVNKVNKQ